MGKFGPENSVRLEGWQRYERPELESHLPGNMGVQDNQSVDMDGEGKSIEEIEAIGEKILNELPDAQRAEIRSTVDRQMLQIVALLALKAE